jgi:hypothetical protein
MSIIQPTGPSPDQDSLATQEVGGMLERMDARGQVTERLLLSLGDWQVIPDDQGKLRVLDAMHVTPRPALLRLRVWRNRIGVAWQAGGSVLLTEGPAGQQGKSLELAETQKLIDCETDLQSGGERFRLIPSQQTIHTGWKPTASEDAPGGGPFPAETGSQPTADAWKESVGSLARSLESIQAMVERWHGEAQQRCDLEQSRDRLRSLSSQLAFCRTQCRALEDLRLSKTFAAKDGSGQAEENQPQKIVREVDGELEEARHAALGLWTSLCADPIELQGDSLQYSLDPEEERSWESGEERWESNDSLTDWEEVEKPRGGLVQIEQPEAGGEAALRVERRREESMREWLQGHFEGRQEEFLLLEQLLFQQPSRRSKDASSDPDSNGHTKPVALERQVAAGMEKKQERSGGAVFKSPASDSVATPCVASRSYASRSSDRIAVLFGCILILGGIGMWNLDLPAWNSKFAGVVAGVIGLLWLFDSIFRLRTAGRIPTPSIEA